MRGREEKRTERDPEHRYELETVSYENGESDGPSRGSEDFSVDELPAEVFLDVLLFIERRWSVRARLRGGTKRRLD